MTEFKKVGSLTDFDLVGELAQSIWTEHYVPMVGQEQVDYMLATHQSFKSIRHQVREGAKYFLVYQDSRPIGYFSYEIREEEAFMSKVYILEDYRRQGVGNKCLSFVQEQASGNHLKALSIAVNKSNKSAIDFYKKNGFEHVDEVAVDIGGGYVLDDFTMRKGI